MDALRRTYPALELTPGLLRLVVHILLTPYRHETDPAIVPLPYRLLANIVGKERRATGHRSLTAPTLGALLGALATPARPTAAMVTAELLPHNATESRATQVRLVFPEPLQSMAVRTRDVPPDNRITIDGWVRVDLDHPRPLEGANKARDAAVARLPDPSHAPELSQALQSYLNAHNPSVYQSVTEQIRSEQTGLFLRTALPDLNRRSYVVAALRDILQQPVPVYATSPRTARISAHGRSLASLSRPVRQELTARAGWVELDLAHAQLACNAAAWNVESVCERLADASYRIWDDMMASLGVDARALKAQDAELYHALKSLIKTPVHGTSFGMGIRNIRSLGLLDDVKRDRKGRPVRRDGSPVVVKDRSAERAVAADVLGRTCGLTVAEAGKRLAGHWVLAAMLEARRTELLRVQQEGARQDVFGVTHEVKAPEDDERQPGLAADDPEPDNAMVLDSGEPDDPVEPRQVLARVTQAAELDLLSRVICDAVLESGKTKSLFCDDDGAVSEPKKKRPLYRIVIWQHDGFTVSPKGNSLDVKCQVIRRLQRLVREQAALRRIPTRLEVDVGPEC